MTATVIGIIAGLISVILGIWQIFAKIHKKKTTHKQVFVHLDTGDRFLGLRELDQAIAEYQKAIDLDRSNMDAQRRIIAANREKVLTQAFLADTNSDIALGGRLDGLGNSQMVNDTLTQIYQLQALHPALKSDIDMLFDEASILKAAGGRRVINAVEVLGKALELAPENDRVLAEYGLLRTISSENVSDKVSGIESVRRAIKLRPEQARYHFYLASSLYSACELAQKHPDNGVFTEAEANAELIPEFRRAVQLATGTDVWSRSILYDGPRRSINIFHYYANHEKDPLTPKLGLPYKDRIAELEFLVQQDIHNSSSGPHDRPYYWLAVLYHAVGNDIKAEECLLVLLDNETWRNELWLRLYLDILESSGRHDETYSRIKTEVEQLKMKT